MRRLIAVVLAVPFAAALMAQQSPHADDGVPALTEPSVPLTYVGADGTVSLGVNSEGQTEGQLLGVFARNNARAMVGQLWWDKSGAGGVQADFNWLLGMTAQEVRERPDAATVARLTFAMDQNAQHDRKATLGFGIERRDYSIEGYLAGGISSARAAGSEFSADPSTIVGDDATGSYTQVETTTIETLFESKPYGAEAGVQVSHVFEPLAMRVHGGASVQDGDADARATTLSIGLDTPLGTRGWGLSALAEHVSSDGSVDDDSDDRFSVYLRRAFGRRAAFAPTSQLDSPAWISRSLGRPSSAHPRTVESYRTQRSQTVSVTRGPKQYTNHFPLLQDDTAMATDGQSVTIEVLANDNDADGDTLTLTAITPPAHGSATIVGARVLYTPVAGFTGADAFRYTASDGRGGTGSAAVAVTVAAQPNQPPIARNDTASTAFGRPVTIPVLANDSDADSDPLSVLSVSAPANGTAVVSGNSVIYTPAPGFDGSDDFTYTIGDGRGGTASATVSITTAEQPNRPPLARADNAVTGFGQAVSIDVLANDIDADGDALALIAVTPPSNGTATVVGAQVLYTPAAGFTGVDTFRYTVGDGRGGSATALVSVVVNAAANNPPQAIDDAATTTSPQPVLIAVLANDSDPDADPLEIVGVTTPANGSVVASPTGITYQPNAGFFGIDSFTYTISDGRGGTDTAVVSVDVAPAANQPPVAIDDLAATAAGQPVLIPVLANDSDPDGDPLAIAQVGVPANGSVVISPDGVTYQPNADFSGIDQFTYTISDGRGGTDTALVTVDIAPAPNQPPIAVDDAIATPAGQAVLITVLANDSDPDGDTLTVIATTPPANGTAVISTEGVIYQPDDGFSGFDQFTYTISDGNGGKASAVVAVFVSG